MHVKILNTRVPLVLIGMDGPNTHLLLGVARVSSQILLRVGYVWCLCNSIKKGVDSRSYVCQRVCHIYCTPRPEANDVNISPASAIVA